MVQCDSISVICHFLTSFLPHLPPLPYFTHFLLFETDANKCTYLVSTVHVYLISDGDRTISLCTVYQKGYPTFLP